MGNFVADWANEPGNHHYQCADLCNEELQVEDNVVTIVRIGKGNGNQKEDTSPFG